jgi:hypothetical protein
MVFAGIAGELPANGKILFSEEDCIEFAKLHYTWTIDFAEQVRNMEKDGKLIRFSEKVPINVLETKIFDRRFKCYKISIYNEETKKHDIVWTDTVKLD